MKFLCLAGSGTNEEVMSPDPVFVCLGHLAHDVFLYTDNSKAASYDFLTPLPQASRVTEGNIEPITEILEKEGGHTFHFLAGTVETEAIKDMDDKLGPPPHLNFLETSWPGASDQQLRETSAKVPPGFTPEEKIRYIDSLLPPKQTKMLAGVLERLYQLQRKERYDVILGHSEGAKIAATFVVDSVKRARDGDDIVPPRCAVFMNGMVPSTTDGTRWLLADQDGLLMPIPTCHILAYNDVMVAESVALYHLCDEELANIVDHGRGHTIPRDPQSCGRMTDGIRKMLDCVQGQSNLNGMAH